MTEPKTLREKVARIESAYDDRIGGSTPNAVLLSLLKFFGDAVIIPLSTGPVVVAEEAIQAVAKAYYGYLAEEVNSYAPGDAYKSWEALGTDGRSWWIREKFLPLLQAAMPGLVVAEAVGRLNLVPGHGDPMAVLMPVKPVEGAGTAPRIEEGQLIALLADPRQEEEGGG